MQGCETGERADSPQAVEQGYTQLQRETPASGNLVFGKRQRFRKVHRFSVELSCGQDRTGQFGCRGVKLVLGGRQPAAGWLQLCSGSQGRCTPQCSCSQGGRRWLRSSTGGLAARKGKDRQIFQCFISLFLNEMSLSSLTAIC